MNLINKIDYIVGKLMTINSATNSILKTYLRDFEENSESVIVNDYAHKWASFLTLQS